MLYGKKWLHADKRNYFGNNGDIILYKIQINMKFSQTGHIQAISIMSGIPFLVSAFLWGSLNLLNASITLKIINGWNPHWEVESVCACARAFGHFQNGMIWMNGNRLETAISQNACRSSPRDCVARKMIHSFTRVQMYRARANGCYDDGRRSAGDSKSFIINV